MHKIILLSIKPEFSNLIFEGIKRIELRKTKPRIEPGSLMLVYNTYPDKAIVGFCKLKKVIETSPSTIWKSHSSKLGIDHRRFNEYYKGRNRAVGLEIEESTKFDQPISLSWIKEYEPKFSPPQTFKYLTKDKLKFLKDKKSGIANMLYNSIGRPISDSGYSV